MKRCFTFYLSLFFLLAPLGGYPCSTFFLKDGETQLFGRNLDWFLDTGIIIKNNRGVTKSAMLQSDDTPANWTSKYGSITFNQFGQEMPFGGMNEAGLVIEQMAMMESTFPEKDSRPAITELQWIQYQLDNHATVAEVIASDKRIRIEKVQNAPKIHFLVCDQQGNCAAIEFIDGHMKAYTKENLPHKAFTNDPYDRLCAYFDNNVDRISSEEMKKSGESKDRFVKAAVATQNFSSKNPEVDRAFAFATLDSIAQGPATVWSIVYDNKGMNIYYKTCHQSQIRRIDLNAFDFACTNPVRYIDITRVYDGEGSGHFQILSTTVLENYFTNLGKIPVMKEQFGDIAPLKKDVLENVNQHTCK